MDSRYSPRDTYDLLSTDEWVPDTVTRNVFPEDNNNRVTFYLRHKEYSGSIWSMLTAAHYYNARAFMIFKA